MNEILDLPESESKRLLEQLRSTNRELEKEWIELLVDKKLALLKARIEALEMEVSHLRERQGQ